MTTRAITTEEHAAAQWLLDAMLSGKLRTDQIRMDVTFSRAHTQDYAVCACIGGWMFLYMRGAHEKPGIDDGFAAQKYVHSFDPYQRPWVLPTEINAEDPLTPLFYPPCGTRNVTRDHIIIALRSFLATGVPVWPNAEPAPVMVWVEETRNVTF